MSETIVGVTENFYLDKFRGIICTFYAIFYFLGLKTVKNSLKTVKGSLNICGPHAGRKLSAPQRKQPKFMRPAAFAGRTPQPEPSKCRCKNAQI